MAAIRHLLEGIGAADILDDILLAVALAVLGPLAVVIAGFPGLG
jgi:hypothetical protein